jgi:hypothetical protein
MGAPLRARTARLKIGSCRGHHTGQKPPPPPERSLGQPSAACRRLSPPFVFSCHLQPAADPDIGPHPYQIGIVR